MDYAIIDLETTGGKSDEEAITEIAVYRFDGNEITDRFVSLVNPERPIHWYVQKLTGINNKMLRRAPKFYEIAKPILDIINGTIIVAHNAKFDYGILKKEFSRLGYNFESPYLCTVQLSKVLFPRLDSYSLGKLCQTLHIPLTNRHRADGDALATVQLFKLILNKKRNLSEYIIHPSHWLAKKNSKEIIKTIDEIPSKKGILYLYDKNQKMIGVYASRNLKRKLGNIFLKKNPKSLELQSKINNVEYEILQGNLISKVITWHYRYTQNPIFTPCTPKNSFQQKNVFDSDMLLIDKGHLTGEKSIIYIEDNQVKGFGFYNLEWQKSNLETIKNRLTKVENHPSLQNLIQNHLNKHKIEQIIRLEKFK